VLAYALCWRALESNKYLLELYSVLAQVETYTLFTVMRAARSYIS